MPDEEIDKIVKEAANQHHPPYDDTAWGKMEVLLDKHLPQKKDRKRPVLLLLVFLLVGTAVFFAINNGQKKQPVTVAENSTATKPAVVDAAQPAATIKTGAVDAASTGIAPAQTLDQSPVPAETAASAAVTKNKLQTNSKQDDAGNDQAFADGRKNQFDQNGRTAIKIKKPGTGSDDEIVAKEKEAPVTNDVINSEDITAKKINTTGVTDVPAAKKEVAKEETVKATVQKIVKEEKPAEKNKTATATKPKNNKSFTDKIGITLSAGADASFVKVENAGKLKPSYGAGLNYDLGKHLTIASGFYVSKKVYAAAPYDYKFPGGYAYPNLVNIEADCDVYEIPVSVYYNFKTIKNHNWLAGASLSSFLMKKETYDYQYKTPSGQAYNYVTTINNENKHYFSVLTISGGYRYKLNDRIAFVAEPYLKVPLAGIGLGKIKLNSTGVLVTAVVKPFAKRKK
jgi:hypothetical protein